MLVALAQQILGPSVVLVCGLLKQLHGLGIILLDRDAVVVEEAQVALGPRVAVVGGLAVELGGPSLVLLYASA